MTRLPTENRDVEGIEYGSLYPKYKVGPLCSVAGCSRIADHPHHIWRRSFVIGDKGWVRLWDGTIVQNLTALCFIHHDLVTVNKAEIRYSDMGNFVWFSDDLSEVGTLLEPQPKKLTALTVDGPVMNIEDIVHNTETHEHVGPGGSEKCPTCKRAIKRESTGPKEKKRHREKWSITVPVDERENGADVLDALLDSCAQLFGHDETRELRYFTVVQALALVVQHGERMVGSE